jgi:hypothetical protein
MTKYLPSNLLSMFVARPPMAFVEAPEQKQQFLLSGVGAYLDQFNGKSVYMCSVSFMKMSNKRNRSQPFSPAIAQPMFCC